MILSNENDLNERIITWKESTIHKLNQACYMPFRHLTMDKSGIDRW